MGEETLVAIIITLTPPRWLIGPPQASPATSNSPCCQPSHWSTGMATEALKCRGPLPSVVWFVGYCWWRLTSVCLDNNRVVTSVCASMHDSGTFDRLTNYRRQCQGLSPAHAVSPSAPWENSSFRTTAAVCIWGGGMARFTCGCHENAVWLRIRFHDAACWISMGKYFIVTIVNT